MTPSCASRATSELSCVRTCMPSETTWAQAGCGLGNTVDLDQARPTGGNRIEQWVVAKAGNFDTEHFCSADNEGSGRHRYRDPVDDDADEVGSGVELRAGLVGDGHRTPGCREYVRGDGVELLIGGCVSGCLKLFREVLHRRRIRG